MQSPQLAILMPWLPALLVPWALALVLTPLVARFARARGYLDLPRGRHLHERGVPYLGGVALIGAAVGGLALVAPFSEPIVGGLWGYHSLGALGLCSVALVALGTWDDLRELRPGVRLSGQIAIAAATWLLGFRCGPIELPFGYAISAAPLASFAVTVAWIVLVTNAFNFIDGIDGLAVGIGIVATLVIFFLASQHGASVPVVAALALSGSLAGFLRFNVPPARIFLGDGGALPIGYLVSVLAMASSQKSPTAVVLIVPMLALAVPLIDILVAVLRRALQHVGERGWRGLNPIGLGSAVMSGDRGHVHYLLLRSGWSVRTTLFVLYGLSAGLGVLALATREEPAAVRWGLWVGLLATGIAVLRWMEQRASRLEATAQTAEATRAQHEQPRVAG